MILFNLQFLLNSKKRANLVPQLIKKVYQMPLQLIETDEQRQ